MVAPQSHSLEINKQQQMDLTFYTFFLNKFMLIELYNTDQKEQFKAEI